MAASTQTIQRYPEIEVGGSPREMGEQLGEAARDQIRGFVATGLERTQRTVQISTAQAMEQARSCVPYVAAYAPQALAELEGMAVAAGVAVDELMLLQIRNQLRDSGGCTAFSLSRERCGAGGAVVAQNWDNDPALDPYTIVLTRRPTGKPAMMDVTQAGLIAYIGLSDAGMGLCMNTLPAPSRPLGVPHYFTVRAIYEARSLEAAVAAVEQAERAIGANILLATPQGPADLEVTLDGVFVLRGNDGQVTHTNHACHPSLQALDERFPELIQSHARLQRLDALLAAAPAPLTVEHAAQLLRDHEGYPRAICRHPNDDAGSGFWRSVFSVIIQPEAGRMHVSRGNPCSAPYETYQLN